MHNVFRVLNQISDSFEWSPTGSSILAQGTALTLLHKFGADNPAYQTDPSSYRAVLQRTALLFHDMDWLKGTECRKFNSRGCRPISGANPRYNGYQSLAT